MLRTLLSAVFSVVTLVGSLSAADIAASNASSTHKAQFKNHFSVYTSGGCTRSFRKIADFDNLRDACEAAQLSSKTGGTLIWIATGNEKEAWNLHPRYRDRLQLQGCSVYVNSCRVGWQIHTKTETAQEAERLAKNFRPQAVEVIYHLKGEPTPLS